MKLGYYPGCSLLTTALEYARSSEGVLAALGVELEEVDDWVCCGATAAHATSHLLSVALPAISCAAAEKQGNDVLTCCSACYSRLKQVNHELKEDPELLAQTNEIIEEDYKASNRVLHVAEFLANDIGVDAIREKVVRPLKGLKVACYYGCLIARLPDPLKIDCAEYPTIVDVLVQATGAEPVDWPHKTECCGAALTLARQDSVVRLSGKVMEMAQEAGADVVAVVCPLCQANLDMYQSNMEEKEGRRVGLPVLYFTQLLALAMGLDADQVMLHKAIVDPRPMMADKGFIEEPVYL